jgi:outer membrane receptor protein involved in Fe transport
MSVELNAGVTGKIKGKVIDSSTGLPLPGVNIIILGTQLGAAVDLEGDFIIIGITPGTYSLRATMIGYHEVIVTDVKVMTDLTTSVEIEMTETTIAIDGEVVVTADKPVIQKDVTASVQNLGISQLQRLPTRNAKEGLLVQTGVFFSPIPVQGGLGSAGKGEPRYSIRGGSQDQVVWYLDGARISNLILGRADWGGSFTNINMNTVEEIQIMTGGYNAEYGNAQSGIVSVVTKEGKEDLHGSIEYIYGFAGKHHFGNYLYDQNTQKEFLDHTLEDGTLDPNWWTDEKKSQIYDYTDIPDHDIKFSLSGPLLNWDGNPVRFFVSGSYKQQAYTLPRPRDTRDFSNLYLNLTQNREKIKWKLTAFYNHQAHSTLQENGDFTNQAKYYRGWGSIFDVYTYGGVLNYNYAPSDKIFYEFKLSTYWSEFDERPSEYFRVGESDDPTVWGFHRYDGYEDEPFDAYTPSLYNNTITGDISFISNVNWQFDKNNLIKSGIEFRYNTFNEKENYRLISSTDNKDYWINRGLMEEYHPIQFAFYVQDKMEFETMILNFGVRYDMFNPNYDWFEETNLYNLAVNPDFDPDLDTDGDQVDSHGNVKYSFDNVLDKARTPAKTYHMVSPRFGVSFPFSENTMIHFNYGHFYQVPPLDQMFEFSYYRPTYLVTSIIEERALAEEEGREERHINSTKGDPERVTAYTLKALEPEKTIQFEAGFKQNFENIGVLEVTAFYKDVYDQTQERIGLFDHHVYGYDPINEETTINVSYQTFISGDYGDSRGFEITFKTLFSRYIVLDANYSFSRATQGRATPAVVNIDGEGNETYKWDGDVNKRIAIEKSYSRPHILRANLFLTYPEVETNNFINKILEGTSASLLYSFISGQAFTYKTAEDPPDTYNNHRYPPIQTVDLLVEKRFPLFDTHTLSFFMQVANLLNTKNLRSYGDAVYDIDATQNYVEDGTITEVDGSGYDIGWQTYYENRRYYFGVKYTF